MSLALLEADTTRKGRHSPLPYGGSDTSNRVVVVVVYVPALGRIAAGAAISTGVALSSLW